ncbi:hypothetical protein NE237_015365 [Protea cynaroides]|uniref:CCHC-type domain-containing protein n=1 Tax=Protea cynaroides TaxID=273540 RepID=A0A9Q0KE23_9MAGN|nr:hypothetical protein NE237_015365 [Protea cynaroides]
MRTNAYPPPPPPPHHSPSFEEHMRSYFDQNVGQTFRRQDDTHKIKMELKEYNGKLDPQVFIDWTNAVDDYFEWFEIPELRKIKLVKTKLTGSTREWWKLHENRMLVKGNPITTWKEMKDDFKDNYLPPSFVDRLYDRFNTFGKFKLGLKPEVRRAMGTTSLYDIKDCYLKALEAEDLLKLSLGSFDTPTRDSKRNAYNQSLNNRTPHQSGITPRTVDKEKSPMKKSDKGTNCYHCNQSGHFAKFCPQKARHANLAVAETEPNDDVEINDGLPLDDEDDHVFANDIQDDDLEPRDACVVRRILVAEIKGKD